MVCSLTIILFKPTMHKILEQTGEFNFLFIK